MKKLLLSLTLSIQIIFLFGQREWNSKITEIIPFKITELCEEELVPTSYFSHGHTTCKVDGEWRCIDSLGKDVKNLRSKEEIKFLGPLVGFKEEKLWGLRNLSGQEVSKPKYFSVRSFKNSLGRVVNATKLGKVGAINEIGKEIFHTEYTHYAFSIKSKYVTDGAGLFSKSGRALLPVGMIIKSPPIEGTCLVGEISNNDNLLFDIQNEVFFESKIQKIQSVGNNQFFIVTNNGNVGLIKRGGKVFEWIVNLNLKMPECARLSIFQNNLIVYHTEIGEQYAFHVSENTLKKVGKYSDISIYSPIPYFKRGNVEGIFNKDGVEIIFPNGFEELKIANYDFQLAAFDRLGIAYKSGEEKGFINKNHEKIIKPGYEHYWVANDYFFTKKGSIIHVFDQLGNQVLKEYENYYLLPSRIPGTIIIRNEDLKKGLIKVDGTLVLPALYDDIDEYIFDSKIFRYIKNSNIGLINSIGNVISKPIYEERSIYDEVIYIQTANFDLIHVIKNEKYGAIDSSGNEIIPTIYDEIFIDRHGFVWLRKGKLWALVKYNG